jgi:hypothetical protein
LSIRLGARPHRGRWHRRGVTAVDRYNKPVYGWTPDEDEARIRVDPLGTNEELGDREVITTRYLIIAGIETAPPAPGDRLEWLDEAKVIELDGDVMPLYDARRLHHYEAEGKVVTGA